MQISVAVQADKQSWLPLWQGYLVFYKHPLPDEMTDLTFDRILDAAFPLHMLVAKEAGEMRWPAMPRSATGSTWSRAGYCYLEDLFVSDDARGKGVGRALIEAVAAAAKDAGIERLYWVTDGGNTAAQALYDTRPREPMSSSSAAICNQAAGFSPVDVSGV